MFFLRTDGIEKTIFKLVKALENGLSFGHDAEKHTFEASLNFDEEIPKVM